MRWTARLGAIVLAGLVWAPATTVARDDAADADAAAEAADTEAPADEAAGKCVTACESEHEACMAAAKTRTDECERQKGTCEAGCAMCTRMYGPQVVYCVKDCEACRAKIAASPCAKGATGDADCTHALDACLERCGP